MKDPEIRTILRSTELLRFAGNAETKIVEEMGLPVAGARVDIAVINDKLHGYEIKGASDTLRRLPKQVVAYSLVFDYLTIVTEPHYTAKIINLIPEWVGVIECFESCVMPIREAAQNPSKKGFHIAKLLWKDELFEVLTGKGIKHRKSDRCWTLCEIMEAHLPMADLTASVIHCLKKRVDWRHD